MKAKTLPVWVLLCGLCFAAVAVQAAGDNATGPKAYIPEPRYEFDPVLDGDEVVHDFAIYNKGDATLEILKVETG